MRVWDIHPKYLCREHLLGEHRETHAIWSIITRKKKGYARHPETMRWRGKLAALSARHDTLVQEMCKRGYHHYSNLDKCPADNRQGRLQDQRINTIAEQKAILKHKPCSCFK